MKNGNAARPIQLSRRTQVKIMPDDTAAMPLFTRDELKQFRYKCSHKLAVSLTVGAVYLLCMTAFFVNKAVHNAGGQDKLHYYGFAAAGYMVIVGLIAMIVRRSQSLNFSRFLNGCIKFDNFGYMLEYVELRMPEPFSPRYLKYPVHLMILGKVLEHSEKKENVEAGHRMVAAAAERDPALEAYREAELADLMKYHETFLAAHQELPREWRNAESFHNLLVHLILPVVIIVGIISFILKGCEPPKLEDQEKAKAPATESVQKTDAAREEKNMPPPETSANGEMKNAAPAVEAGTRPVTAPETETVPQA